MKQIITRPDGSKYVQMTRIQKPVIWTEEQQRTQNWLDQNKRKKL